MKNTLRFSSHPQRNTVLIFVCTIIVWVLGYNLITFFATSEIQRSTLQLYGTRLSLIASLVLLFYISWNNRNDFLRNIPNATRNISILRLIYFGFFLVGLPFSIDSLWETSISFAQLPESTQTSFPIFGWFFQALPKSEIVVNLFIFLFILATLGSFLGIRTRLSILLFIVSSCYLFALPNLYGKINHNHHIVWFALILLFSPCDTFYSIQAWLKSKRDSALPITHSNSATYALFGWWSLIGLIYFFPGFWKLWTSGLDWAFTANFKHQLYSKWFELGDWLPVFRIDYHPYLLDISGLFTVSFELFFLFFIFQRKLRPYAIISGLLFHAGTLVFMDIFFVVLLLSYIGFINWQQWFPPKTIQKTTQDSLSNIQRWTINILLFGVFSFGILKVHSWPLSVYPTFDEIIPLQREALYYEGITIEETIEPLDKSILRDKYSPERLNKMEWDIIQDFNATKQVEEEAMLLSFIQTFEKKHKKLTRVNVFLETTTIDPDVKKPTKRLLILSRSF